MPQIILSAGSEYACGLPVRLMENASLAPSTETRTFPGRLESLTKISRFVSELASAAGFDQTAVYAIDMAVDEACSNIIEHAYGGEGKGDIECTCHIQENELTITLRDHGRPFDPSDVPAPNIYGSLEERKEGGLGLFLIGKLMDEVRFEFTPDSGNILTMVKRKEKPA